MLTDYVQSEVLTVPQAVRAVEDVLFKTSNDLYNLHIPLKPLVNSTISLPIRSAASSNQDTLASFLSEYSSTKFLRLQYLDYTSTPRVRIIPVKRALNLLESHPHLQIGLTKASLGLLQNDTIIRGVSATGEYKLRAEFSSLRPGPYEGYAFVQCDFYEPDGCKYSEITPPALDSYHFFRMFVAALLTPASSRVFPCQGVISRERLIYCEIDVLKHLLTLPLRSHCSTLSKITASKYHSESQVLKSRISAWL